MQIAFHQPETLTRKLALVSLFCVGALSSEAGLTKLPHRQAISVGMESALLGTRLDSSEGITNAEALLQNITDPAHICGGKNEFTLRFSGHSVFEKISFLNDGIEGSVSIHASPNAKDWTQVGSGSIQANDRQFVINPGSSQGKYIKFEFNVVKSGTVRCLRILGSSKDNQYELIQNSSEATQVNFADGIGGGRMIYAGHPDKTHNQLTVIYDLKQTRSILELASLHSTQALELHIHATNSLQEKENWRGRMELNPQSLLDESNLVVKMQDAGLGRAQVKLNHPVLARYVAFTWVVNSELQNFVSYDIGIFGHSDVVASRNTTGQNSHTALNLEMDAGSKSEAASAQRYLTSAFVNDPTIQDGSTFQNARNDVSFALYQQFISTRDFMIGGGSFGSDGARSNQADKSGRFPGSGRSRANEEDVTAETEEEEFQGPPVFLDWSLAPSAP